MTNKKQNNDVPKEDQLWHEQKIIDEDKIMKNHDMENIDGNHDKKSSLKIILVNNNVNTFSHIYSKLSRMN